MAVTLYPTGYGTTLVDMAELRRRHEPKMHPAYARRLFPWLESKQGRLGIGGGWRAIQPSKPGFAPPGKSFHQNQTFASGFVGYCAVDLVAPDGPDGNNTHDGVAWSMVPAQHSPEAHLWGVHCNIGTPGADGSEPWHMQPVEIDGWQSWVNAGRPDPAANYPIPTDPPDPPDDPPPPTGAVQDMMYFVWQNENGGYCFGVPGAWGCHIDSAGLKQEAFRPGGGRAINLADGKIVSSFAEASKLTGAVYLPMFPVWLGVNYGV